MRHGKKQEEIVGGWREAVAPSKTPLKRSRFYWFCGLNTSLSNFSVRGAPKLSLTSTVSPATAPLRSTSAIGVVHRSAPVRSATE